MGNKGGKEGKFCEDHSAVRPDLTHWVDSDWSQLVEVLKLSHGIFIKLWDYIIDLRDVSDMMADTAYISPRTSPELQGKRMQSLLECGDLCISSRLSPYLYGIREQATATSSEPVGSAPIWSCGLFKIENEFSLCQALLCWAKYPRCGGASLNMQILQPSAVFRLCASFFVPLEPVSGTQANLELWNPGTLSFCLCLSLSVTVCLRMKIVLQTPTDSRPT